MTTRYLKLTPALIALVAAPCALHAETDAGDIVVTATRSEQAAQDVGQAVTIIDKALIVQRQAQTVSDLLSTTPGVTASRNGGIGGFTGVRIRGAEAEQTLVLIDGVKINDPSSPGGGFDFGNLLIGNINRIEVLRGPNSVPWGSQAIGGVVNIITEPPGEGSAVDLRAEYGYADTAQGVVNANFRAGPVAASFGGGYFRSDGISSFAGGTERDGYRNYGANGRVEVTLSDAIAVDLRGYYSHGRADLDGFPAPLYAFADTPEYSTSQEVLGYAGIRAKLFDGRFTNRLAFTISDVNRDNYDPSFGTAAAFLSRGRVERFEYQGDFKLTEQVRAVFGAETETSRFNDGFTTVKTGIDSLYGQLIVKPLSALTLTGGVRYDDHQDFGSETTLGGNAALNLASGTTLRASYAEGFKAPTLFQLRSAFGNVELQPERARSIDVGIEQRLIDDQLVASITWFQRKTRNQIDFISCFNDATPKCVGRPFGTYDNIARARAKGLEFELTAKPTDALTVNAAYSYIDSENRSVGNPNFGNALARRPHHSVSLSADYAPVTGLSFGTTIQHVGDSFENAANSRPLDGYVVVGLRAAWRFDPRFELYGRVDNLFDTRYQTVADYSTIGRAAYVGVRAGF